MNKVYSFAADAPGTRLDKFVSEKCPELSRSAAQKLITGGYVTVNGKGARSSLKLEAGDRIEVTIPPTPESPLTAEDISIKIVYEDNDLMVIDKQAGLTVHPAPGNPEHTLVNAILKHYPDLAAISDSLRPGIVHRLDKDTSGLIIIAKNKAAQDNLVNQFKARTVTKAYFVLVKGKLTPERGTIEADIGRDSRDRKRMAVVSSGRESRTEYRVLRHINGYTLAEVLPKTGRTHQIRVHFSAIGYPVVGDAVYGVKSPCLSRQFLHAHRLGFKLPSSGKYVEFTSELPEDLQQALKELGDTNLPPES
ncbi:MAG: RluA family pseudouridine synthase [Dehalococcoidales bacterium]|nr:RluA family pseudouridine synthase [Dehalococcoidales bacterium]